MHNIHSIMHTIVIILLESIMNILLLRARNNNNNNKVMDDDWARPPSIAWPRRHDVPRSRRLHQYLGTTS